MRPEPGSARGYLFLMRERTFIVPLAILACLLGWGVVHVAPGTMTGLLLGGLALTIWLLFPESTIYALVLLCPFAARFDVGELSGVQAHDPILVALGISVVTSVLAGPARLERFKTSWAKTVLFLWLLLTVWGSISYLVGPANQWFLSDPIHNVWFLYRGVWRYLLPLPLVLYAMKGRESARRAIDALLITSVLVSIYALWLSRSLGTAATGPFDAKNQLASFLVLVIPFATGRLFFESGVPRRLLYFGMFLLFARTLMLTGSRGGYAALMASLVPLAFCVPRRRLVAAGSAGLLILSLAVILKGDILERPYVRRVLSLSSPQEQVTVKWRFEQWRLFTAKIADRPWFGTGSDVDKSLVEQGLLGTPHNGYLSLVVISGIPVAIAWVALFLVLAIPSVRFLTSPAVSSEDKTFWAGFAGFLTALIVHNLVDSTIPALHTQVIFWTSAGIAIIKAFSYRQEGLIPSRADCTVQASC